MCRRSSALFPFLFSFLGLFGQAQTVSVKPAAETEPVPSQGDAADDLAIWVHPSDPGLSTVIGTDKKAGLAVYDLEGKQLQFRADGRFNNVDVRYHFRLPGGEVSLVASGERQRKVLAIYTVDPGTRHLEEISARVIPLGIEVYGCCMYQSRVTGDTCVFCTSEQGVVQQWKLFATGTGRVDAELVRSFDVGDMSEGCVADDENAYLFVGQEDIGIWRYGAEPGDGNARILVDKTRGGHLEADVEGLAIYYAEGGGGYLIASSQGNDSYVVYQRSAPHDYVLTFGIAANAVHSIDAVSGTDGIDVTNLGLGSRFPGGLFLAQDDSNPGGKQNFKFVGWAEIAAAAKPPLVVDASYDPHGARSPRSPVRTWER